MIASDRRPTLPQPPVAVRRAGGGSVSLLGREGQEPHSLASHLRAYGPVGPIGTGLISAVQRSGVLGRGGGAFPTGRKLRAVAERGGRPVVVANGAEGEPTSAKDAVLLALCPHLVLDGALAAAAALRASRVIVCVARAAAGARAAVAAAIADLDRHGSNEVAIEQYDVPDRFVAGEETALVHWLNGGQAKPTFAPPRPFERGVGGRPTLVNNVETFAHVGLIARFGPEWYRTTGLPHDPGMTLVTMSGSVASPGVLELATGTSLTEAIEAAGRASEPLGAFLVGGFFGGWVPLHLADRIPLTHAPTPGLPSLGAGAIVAFPDRACPLAETARILDYLAREGAGQCGPCAFGLPAIAEAAGRLAAGADRRAPDRLRRWSGQVTGRGACRHPDAAARLVRSTLETFPEEVAAHANGSCSREAVGIVRVPPADPMMVWQ